MANWENQFQIYEEDRLNIGFDVYLSTVIIMLMQLVNLSQSDSLLFDYNIVFGSSGDHLLFRFDKHKIKLFWFYEFCQL